MHTRIQNRGFRCLWWVVWVRGDAGRVGWRHGCLSPVHRRASVAVTLEGGVRGLPRVLGRVRSRPTGSPVQVKFEKRAHPVEFAGDPVV